MAEPFIAYGVQDSKGRIKTFYAKVFAVEYAKLKTKGYKYIGQVAIYPLHATDKKEGN